MTKRKTIHITTVLFFVIPVIAILSWLYINTPLTGQEKTDDSNPLLQPYNTPFNVPPFDKIKDEHYIPAFKEGILQEQKEIEAIINSPEPPTFANTIEAMDGSGALLGSIESIFGAIRSSNSNDNIQKMSIEINSMITRHRDSIALNEKLFDRIKTVYDIKDKLTLSEEQQRLLEEIYKGFTRNGANLNEEKKTRLKAINEELGQLSLKFADNVLKENKGYNLVIEKKEDLDGLPKEIIDGAAQKAIERGFTGKWVFTLERPSIFPFLQYSKKRDLREKIFTAYSKMGNNGNELDNKAIISKIVTLRLEKAKLLGYPTHASYVLEENMAQNSDRVYKFLYEMWPSLLEMAKSQVVDFQSIIKKEGGNFKLEPWDWWYYSGKLKKARYAISDEMIRPYFKLENVRDGAFYVANKLYGLKFIERKDLPRYQPDVQVFEVHEADDTPIGILYIDYFMRSGKRSGAWCGALLKESKHDGKRILPIITNNHNLTRPAGNEPALLNFTEVKTVFHEFGHGLHQLLSQCTYQTLSGTSVPRDFVELPSQIMENWALEPEVLKVYAKHYKTGEVIPQSYIEKLEKSDLFEKVFESTETMAAALLDMDWHTITESHDYDVEKFEADSITKIKLIHEIIPRYRSTYFSHIFSGGYSSGYYSYIWAEVLDADAFRAFQETSLFDQNVAKAFRINILEKGGSAEPMTLYKRFRGAEPKIDPLLERNGFKPKKEKK